MKKSADRFWFRLYPSNQKVPKKGSATHYGANKGIVEIEPAVAAYIFQCVTNGSKPRLFVQGWWNNTDETFTVGFAVPHQRAARAAVRSSRVPPRTKLKPETPVSADVFLIGSED